MISKNVLIHDVHCPKSLITEGRERYKCPPLNISSSVSAMVMRGEQAGGQAAGCRFSGWSELKRDGKQVHAQVGKVSRGKATEMRAER